MTIVFCNRRRETTIGIDRWRESAVRGMKTERAKSPEERSVSPETIDSARNCWLEPEDLQLRIRDQGAWVLDLQSPPSLE
ncbi:hypothetical protein MRB53_034609 [Persea americana]|uniref:Uncharacterized protein n=1 Tax=Persea americana TaxID=3435 RepID=A0ACC2K2A7_PERAE|nr:hypothetical protein MRB53_034609 [Persea americana]